MVKTRNQTKVPAKRQHNKKKVEAVPKNQKPARESKPIVESGYMNGDPFPDLEPVRPFPPIPEQV